MADRGEVSIPDEMQAHGGPGTGRTVVALHRTAYLLHSDPRIGDRRCVIRTGDAAPPTRAAASAP